MGDRCIDCEAWENADSIEEYKIEKSRLKKLMETPTESSKKGDVESEQ